MKSGCQKVCLAASHHDTHRHWSEHQGTDRHGAHDRAVVTKPAPSFTATAVMPDGSIKDVSLQEFYGNKYVLLYFYPLDFTFVCPSGKVWSVWPTSCFIQSF